MVNYSGSAIRVDGFDLGEARQIPRDWIVRTIGDAMFFQGGSQPDKSVFRSTWKPDYVRLIQIRDYKTDRFETFIPKSLARKFCTSSDIMIGRYGPPVFQILRGLEGAYNVALIKVSCGDEINPDYAYYFLSQRSLFEFVEKLSQRSSGQTGVDLVELKRHPLPLPPTKAEQRAIAGALSDADALIESLEALLAKKRAIKLGATQELLSGGSPLNSSAAWTKKSFGEVFDFLPTATNSRADLSEEGDAAYVHYGDIHTIFHQRLDFSIVSPTRINFQRCGTAARLRNGDWIMADASEDFDGVCKSIEVMGLKDGEVAVSGLHTFLLREKQPTFAPGFKTYLGDAVQLRDQYLRVLTGMKVFGVSKANLRGLMLPIPSWSEQESIRDILDAMSLEIAALEKRLAKARCLKDGMMHELLTGRVRLA